MKKNFENNEDYIVSMIEDGKSTKDILIEIRKSTGMNRKEFCAYFGIPYRTMQDWELGNREMPDYLLRLMGYKVSMEKLQKEKEDTDERQKGRKKD